MGSGASLQQRAALLRNTPLMFGISDEKEIEAIAKLFKHKFYKSGEQLYTTHFEDPSREHFYVISKGCVQLLDADTGAELCIFSPPDLFGGSSQISTTKAVAMEPVEVMVLDKTHVKPSKNVAMQRLDLALQHVDENHLLQLLRSMPFFQQLEEVHLKLLCQLFRFVAFNPSEIVVQEGSIADSFYVVAHGNVHVTQKHGKTGIIELAVLGVGEFFGEVGLIEKRDRLATVTSHEEGHCTLLQLMRDDFWKFVNRLPEGARTFDLEMRVRSLEALHSMDLAVLKGFSDRQLRMLAETSRLTSYDDNTAIFSPKQASTTFYMIVKGSVQMMCTPDDKESSDLEPVGALLENGEYFGEVSLLRNEEHAFEARATSNSLILEIDKENFLKILAHHPEAKADFELRLNKDKCNLKAVLEHPEGLRVFSEFLKKELADESVLFWTAVEDFRSRGLMAGVEDSAESTRELLAGVEGSEKDVLSNIPHLEPGEMLEAARNLFETFVSESADQQVNISDSQRCAIEDRLSSADGETDLTELFEEAKGEIYKQMERDNYARFKGSKEFATFLSEMHCYDCIALRRMRKARIQRVMTNTRKKIKMLAGIRNSVRRTVVHKVRLSGLTPTNIDGQADSPRVEQE